MADRNIMAWCARRAKYWTPTEDEWYKAAYYRGGGTGGGYWTYRRSNPPGQHPARPGNHANFGLLRYGEPSLYGSDKPANAGRHVCRFGRPLRHVRPRRQRLAVERNGHRDRVVARIRGGSFELGDTDDRVSHRVGEPPTYASCYVGFRVAKKRSGP